MPIVRATVKLHPTGADPVDDVMNVWHFFMDETLTAANAEPIGDAMATFYGTWSSVIASSIARTDTHEIEFAQLAMGGPGAGDDVLDVPTLIYLWGSQLNAAAVDSVNLPREVAVCLSMSGTVFGFPEDGPGITRPRARRRGRVYLGPFNSAIMDDGVGGGSDARVDLAPRLSIVAALGTMYSTLDDLTVPATPGIYSPTNGTIALLSTWYVDNAFDTMRSRGAEGTSRAEGSVAEL